MKARALAWELIEATPTGFPWIEAAGKALDKWLVMDATLHHRALTCEEGAGAHVEDGLRLPLTRLLGHHDDPGLQSAEPDTLRYRVWRLPARLARRARQRVHALSPHWLWTGAFLTCLDRLSAIPAPG